MYKFNNKYLKLFAKLLRKRDSWTTQPENHLTFPLWRNFLPTFPFLLKTSWLIKFSHFNDLIENNYSFTFREKEFFISKLIFDGSFFCAPQHRLLLYSIQFWNLAKQQNSPALQMNNDVTYFFRPCKHVYGY